MAVQKILGIIQARVGSSRLPAKVLLPLAGKSVIEHVISRVRASERISDILVATSTSEDDKRIEDICKSLDVIVFRGSKDDVLDRFYRASQTVNPEHIVRITADCPMIDPQIIDEVIKTHLEEKADYTTNTLVPMYPDGEDVEVIKTSVLNEAWKKATLLSEREHVTPYIRKHADRFKLVNVAYQKDLTDKRWTLDEPQDYEFLKAVFDSLYAHNNLFGMEEVLEFLRKTPLLESINKNIVRNEGYKKSLEKDIGRKLKKDAKGR